MNSEAFLDKAYHLSFSAGMNHRYHQSREHRWNWADRTAKIIVAILAVAALCLCVVTAQSDHWGWDAVSIVVASLAAIAAVALNVLPFGEWAKTHNALFQRWTDFREEIDAVRFEGDGAPTAIQLELLRAFRNGGAGRPKLVALVG